MSYTNNNKIPLQKFVKDVWLVTFSDLITLILTFFIMLLAMSSLNAIKLEKTFGSFKNIGEKYISEEKDKTLSLKEKLIFEDGNLNDIKNITDLESWNEFISKIKPILQTNREFFVKYAENSIEISIANDILFEDETFIITDASKKEIKNIADILKEVPYNIIIQGNIKRGDKRLSSIHDFTDNYKLSLKYTRIVLDEFIKNNINPSRLAIIGLGDLKSPEQNNIDIIVEINT